MNKDYLESKAHTYIKQLSYTRLRDPFLYIKEQDMLIMGYQILIPSLILPTMKQH